MLIADEEQGDELNKEEDKKISEEITSKSLSISLEALSGAAQHSTMKLRGTKQGKPVFVLVDSGSTHSFVDEQFSERLKLPNTTNEVFEVLVANGEKFQSRGLCIDVVIGCQGK